MLFTRCPQCETTFHITEQALQKAAGQVRCGRCAHIFDAFEELRERGGRAVAGGGRSDAGDAGAATRDERAGRSDDTERYTPDGERDALVDREQQMSEDEVEAVLEEAITDDVEPAWLRDTAPPDTESNRLWSAAAAAALLLLLGQAVHHYRAALAGLVVIGPAVQSAYAALGMNVSPRWNVEQYDLLDWTAVAEPTAGGRGNLVIRSRLRNAGPREQPYPSVLLRLLDRWEKTIGSRVFEPAAYLAAGEDASSMMAVGETVEAMLVIVDPGPDAYGFELDVCVETVDRFECTADTVFD